MLLIKIKFKNSIAGRSGLDLKDQLGPVFRVVLTNILFVFFTQCYRFQDDSTNAKTIPISRPRRLSKLVKTPLRPKIAINSTWM
jgi:hypothetical protein